MGVGRIQANPRTARSVRTVVRAASTMAIPADLMSWAAQQSVRIVSRGAVNEAIAAARDTNAALLIVHCELVRHDAGLLGNALMKAQLQGAVLCLGAPEHRSAFLTHGADDYLSDRASFRDILAHATRLLETTRDSSVSASGLRRPARTVIEIGPVIIELLNRRVFVRDEALKLRPAEFEVLVFLALNRHRPVSAHEITRDALGASGDGSSARNQLFELRRKLREVGLPDVIATERGLGYRLMLQ